LAVGTFLQAQKTAHFAVSRFFVFVVRDLLHTWIEPVSYSVFSTKSLGTDSVE
jgi:hypothetical protein